MNVIRDNGFYIWINMFEEDTKTNKRPKEICEIDDELKAIYHSHDTV